MSKTAGHTATPWSLGTGSLPHDPENHAIIADGMIVARVEYGTPSHNPDESKANAALIVTAVNSHASNLRKVEALREALRDALADAESRLYALPANDDPAVSAQKDNLSVRIGTYRRALKGQP